MSESANGLRALQPSTEHKSTATAFAAQNLTVRDTQAISLDTVCSYYLLRVRYNFLSRLTGIRFPTAARMRTKAASDVTCNHDPSLAVPKYEIEDIGNRGCYVEVKETDKAIQER